VQAIMRETGIIPEKVHVELLRDMGKSAAERTSIDIGINRRTKEKKSNRVEFAEQLGRSPETITATELIRYELWKEQGGKCAYWMLRKNAESITGGHIRITDLQDSSTALQIDHILPRSRTFDNSFHNLCLCTADANQAKKNRTPWEWIGCRNEKAWHKYETWIKSLRIKGLKKRNYLLKNLSEDVAGRFHARNLSDSRYATKLVLAWLEEEYERLGVDCHDQLGKEIKRFRARPGQLTAILRKAWGVNGLKYDSDNNRIGDRHHALDALLVACATESTLQKMTSLYKQMENNAARYRLVPNAEKPWGGFVKDTRKLLNDVFVSRAERGSTKGALHKDTLRQIRTEEDGYGNEIKRVYERKAIADLTEKDLCNIKDADRNSRLITILRDWISNGKPLDTPPLSPKGDPISKIRICTGRFSSGICVKRGQGIAQADNGSIVRTDVYTQNGKFYLVPVYTHHVAKGIVPNRAAKALKDEKYWDVVDESYDFCFSLQPNCYVVTEDKKGKVVEGYYGGMNRRTCTITLNKPFDKSTPPLTPGTKTLKSLTKYRVDRFGRLHKVHTEPRP
jgi:CRISPR-associated endonuclease Csn1